MALSPNATDPASSAAASTTGPAILPDVELTDSDARRDPLRLPEGVDRYSIRWAELLFIGGIHLLALLAVLPVFYSWQGLVAMLVGFYAFGTLGINLCYHRLLTHRSFTCPRWVERVLTLLAFCNLQGSSVRWVAAHRMHHRYSDEQPDPHSPLVNFLWGHMGWMMVWNEALDAPGEMEKYAADLDRDPFHRWLSANLRWLYVWAAHVVLHFAVGYGLGWMTGGASAGLWMGLSFVVWGVLVRSVAVWHVTWSINSLTHLWGYKNYKTKDSSKNNWLMGYLAMGEGWHNNHHADQRSAAAGHRWWEVDVTYLTILVMKLFGIADNIIKPSRNDDSLHSLERRKIRAGDDEAAAAPSSKQAAQ